jgi:inorganic pyrophosphatase
MLIKKCSYITLLVCAFSCNKKIDYYHIPSYSAANNLNAVIEIPAGTNKKFEYNKDTQSFEIDKKDGKDRVVQFLSYPGNYGYIPSTFSDPEKGGDGDALDVLVLSESVASGTILEIVPIAVLKLIDDGELDYKIIAVPLNENDRIIKATTFNEFTQKYPKVKTIIELWFLNYNKDDKAKIDGWGDEKEAKKEIKAH